MIVIVIIVLLTQMGNIGGLFRSRERNKVEEIAVKIVAAIDESKIDTLLGKTVEGKIVRKRTANITLDNAQNTIEFSSMVNLAEEEEDKFDDETKIEKSWTLAGMESFFYECPSNNEPLTLTDIGITFQDDTITFSSTTSPAVPNNIVLLLTHINTAHEIHIDRRTGLTYEIDSK